jgi:beta-lactam-binding protein with PASTA domain
MMEKIKAVEAARKVAQAKAEAEAQASLIPVPNVIGQWLAEAQRILAAQGYKIQQNGKAAGIISAQSPAANTRVKKGSTVTITVGK